MSFDVDAVIQLRARVRGLEVHGRPLHAAAPQCEVGTGLEPSRRPVRGSRTRSVRRAPAGGAVRTDARVRGAAARRTGQGGRLLRRGAGRHVGRRLVLGPARVPAHCLLPHVRDPVAGRDSHQFEFVVPMVPPAWDDAETVRSHVDRLLVSDAPTAVAISTLDVCQPAMDTRSVDYYGHWCLTHFLLDGHHKMHAAADSGRPLRLLSLLSVVGSLATAEQIAEAVEVRAHQPAARE